jgi:hypothetical protein
VPILNYIEENVDIYELPTMHDVLCGRKGDEIVIGDLHANTMKYIRFLIRHGVIRGMTDLQYKALVNIFCIPGNALTKQNLIEFNSILNAKNLTYNPLVKITVIGDDTADRVNSCDILMLLLNKSLVEHAVRPKIIISNHSVNLVEACELKSDFGMTRISYNDSLSMRRLEDLVKSGVLDHKYVYSLYQNYYKRLIRSTVRIIDDSDPTNPIVCTVSHAGIDHQTVREMAEYLMVTPLPQDPSFKELMATMDAIDKTYKAVIEGNLINQTYDPKIIDRAYEGRCNLRGYPFESAMWNRDYDSLTERTEQCRGYRQWWVHGHDDTDYDLSHVCDLDKENELGKSVQLHRGTSNTIYSTSHALPSEIVRKYHFKEGSEVAMMRARRAAKVQASIDACEMRFVDSEPVSRRGSQDAPHEQPDTSRILSGRGSQEQSDTSRRGSDDGQPLDSCTSASNRMPRRENMRWSALSGFREAGATALRHPLFCAFEDEEEGEPQDSKISSTTSGLADQFKR